MHDSPPQLPLARRAAQYVRMSTEHQQYSTENQADKILDYAAQHGFEIVRTYADEGKSGLSISGRDGLQRLLADVKVGNTDFEAVLVYDVSRWGRFQDADESAHYEYTCKQAGILVIYCAEQFENDGSPVNGTTAPPIGTATMPRSRTSGTSMLRSTSDSATRLAVVTGASSMRRTSALAYS